MSHAAQAEGKDLDLSGVSLEFSSGEPATTCLGVSATANAPMLLGRQLFFFYVTIMFYFFQFKEFFNYSWHAIVH